MCNFFYLLSFICFFSFPTVWGKDLVWHQRSDVLSGKDFVYINCPGSSLNSCLREKMNLPGNENSIELKGSHSKTLPLNLYLNSTNPKNILTVKIKGKNYPVKWSNDYASETVTTEELLKIKNSSPKKSLLSRVKHFFSGKEKINDQLSGMQGCCDKVVKKDSVIDPLYTYLEKCFNRLEVVDNDGKTLLAEKGIYRLSANKSKVIEFAKQYKNKNLNKCPGDDVHEIVGVIKNEIMNNNNFKVLDFDNHKNGDTVDDFVRKQKEKLLPAQLDILCLFLKHLNKVATHQEANKMTEENLAIGVGVNLWKSVDMNSVGRQQEILKALIENPNQFCSH